MSKPAGVSGSRRWISPAGGGLAAFLECWSRGPVPPLSEWRESRGGRCHAAERLVRPCLLSVLGSDGAGFAARQSGALIECFVTKQKLEKLSGSELDAEQAVLSAFIDYRFDLEEIAEELIQDEAFNEEGHIIIG